MNEDDKMAMKTAWQQWHADIDPDLVPNVNFSFEVGFEAGITHARGISDAVIAGLLAVIHRDGGQHAHKVGIKQACIDAEVIVAGMTSQIDAVDNLIKQAALAEREACAQVCENGHFLHDQAPTAIFGKECARAIRFRSGR